MTFEHSNGKARPTLPRSSDLVPLDAAPKPTAGRGPGGRFAAGNPIGLGARWKASISKLLGPKATEGEAAVVRGDAQRVYLATLRAMPCDEAPVRSMAALHARHVACAAFYAEKAAAAGLDTPRGMELQAAADRQSQRAERVLVTCHDIASKLKPRADREAKPPSWIAVEGDQAEEPDPT